MDTVIDGFRTELTRQDKSPATIRNYTNDVELFAKWMNETYGGFDVAKVVQRDIIEYRSHLLTAQSGSPATVNRRLASLSKFFGWCMATKLTKAKQNPVDGVKSISISDPGPRSLDTKSLRRLLREVHVHGNARDIAAIEVLAGTAARVGELVQLAISDVEVSERKGVLHIRNGKGRASRQVPLNVDVRKALIDWLATRPATTSNYLFIGQRGEKMTPSGVWRIVKKYADLASIPDLRVHDLRHTVLTRLVREFGTDFATVARISGHRNLKTLMRYTQPTGRDVAEAVEKLAFTGDK
jgi:site-specific recombinase XerD